MPCCRRSRWRCSALRNGKVKSPWHSFARAAKSIEKVEKLGRNIASATDDLASLEQLQCRAEEQFDSFRKLKSDLDEEVIRHWAEELQRD